MKENEGEEKRYFFKKKIALVKKFEEKGRKKIARVEYFFLLFWSLLQNWRDLDERKSNV